MSIDPALKASIAVTRFGLGAKPGEIDAAKSDPAGYLKAQIRPGGGDQPQGEFKTSAANFIEVRDYQLMRRQDKATGADVDPVKQALNQIRKDTQPEFLARARLGCQTDAGFRERWTLFWCNHFTVAAKNLQTAVLVGPFEREAIRPHVFGRFVDLLGASTLHPAMLTYLDQEQSVGPHSPIFSARGVGQFQPRNLKGLNENLAREILELHTLGVGSGYTQADVTEFARALTGWSVQGPNRFGNPAISGGGAPGQFTFRAAYHEPGSRHIFGQTYNGDGPDQAVQVLEAVAASPATAHHLATKIARHFVADDPPPALVARLEQTYLSSGQRLDKVAEVLIDSPEAWEPRQQKFKTPYEFLVSSYRSVNLAPDDFARVGPVLNSMGQQPFNAPSPKGWAEEAQAWASPDAIVKRMGWSEGFAAAMTPAMGDPVQIAQNTLGDQLTPPVRLAVARAESRPEALSILLMSPEFQRR
jgi:uncharacterized protein (DUF1800 family)